MPTTPKRTLIADAVVTAIEGISAGPLYNFTIDTVKKGTWVFEDTSALPAAEVFIGVTNVDATRQRESQESTTEIFVAGWLPRTAGTKDDDELEKWAQDIITAVLAAEDLGLSDDGVWSIIVTTIEKDNLLDANLSGPCACLVEFAVQHENDRAAF